MTICIGIRVEEGLVALADTQIVRGSERASKAKLSTHDYFGHPLFVMTSGLRSVRDKTLIYLEESFAEETTPKERLHAVASALGATIRRVWSEDGTALAESELDFNLHAIIGGQLDGDPEPALFHVYPEGNWVEAEADVPYFVIGRTSFGRPVLDRLLHSNTDIERALALAYLAFDATRTSVTDVDYPVDVAVLRRDDHELRRHRYSYAELASVADWWHERLGRALSELPMDWARPVRGRREER